MRGRSRAAMAAAEKRIEKKRWVAGVCGSKEAAPQFDGKRVIAGVLDC